MSEGSQKSATASSPSQALESGVCVGAEPNALRKETVFYKPEGCYSSGMWK